MRGKLLGDDIPDELERITPADAGKTFPILSPIIRKKDHPRGCGENLEYVGNACSETGSPPRMRGKHLKKRAC